VGSGGTGRSQVLPAFLCPVLQGAAQPIDERGDVARADIAASTSTRRRDRRHVNEVTFDQLQFIQGREQPRGARETLQSARMGRIRDFT
jgi:hypothetical protein